MQIREGKETQSFSYDEEAIIAFKPLTVDSLYLHKSNLSQAAFLQATRMQDKFSILFSSFTQFDFYHKLRNYHVIFLNVLIFINVYMFYDSNSKDNRV